MNPPLLPHLEAFAAAAELGSFTAAARSMGLTQAAVSQRIQALERELRIPLFKREGGHAYLTDVGHRLVPFAQKIVALHQQARVEVTGKQTAIAAELSLAASSIPGEHLLPALLAVFRQKHPHVQVRVSINDSQAVLREVERSRAYLGLTGRKGEDKQLDFRAFARDEMVLVVASDDPWARRKQVTVDQLCKRPLILREEGSGSRWCLEQSLHRLGKRIGDLNVALELGSNEAIKEAVTQGMGVAILSSHAIQKEQLAGNLHTLRIQGLTLERELYVVWDRRRALPVAARLFMDFVHASTSAETRP
ncbi:MAG: LysR family transcriptional regulator [Planctomycetes bacterium]|nr:LysR family transcriptional regulator [Planctomycetota bacterium]